MDNFVKVRFDVRCKWLAFPPQYRIYVNDEMFTERTFNFNQDEYIKEMLQINAGPGVYEFWLEELEPKTGTFTVSNPTIEMGNAKIIGHNKFEILS